MPHRRLALSIPTRPGLDQIVGDPFHPLQFLSHQLLDVRVAMAPACCEYPLAVGELDDGVLAAIADVGHLEARVLDGLEDDPHVLY
jgi:hypothetical protein